MAIAPVDLDLVYMGKARFSSSVVPESEPSPLEVLRRATAAGSVAVCDRCGAFLRKGLRMETGMLKINVILAAVAGGEFCCKKCSKYVIGESEAKGEPLNYRLIVGGRR